MLEEISAHIYKQYKIMRRRPGELAHISVYPFTALLSVGIYAYYLISRGAPIDSMLFAFVGVIVWNFFELSQRGITYGITFEIWSDSLRHTFTAKSRIRHFVIGNSIFGLSSATIALVLLGIVGIPAFGFNIFSGGPILLANLFFVFLFATGIGMMIDSMIVSKGEKWMSLIWMGTGIIMIFSGIYFPATILPLPMQWVAFALPSTHALNAIRAHMLGYPAAVFPELILAGGLSVLFLLIGILAFKQGLKKGKEAGILTAY